MLNVGKGKKGKKAKMLWPNATTGFKREGKDKSHRHPHPRWKDRISSRNLNGMCMIWHLNATTIRRFLFVRTGPNVNLL